MTIIEAISITDSVKPNIYSQTEKIRWLSRLDGMIKSEIIDTHESGDDITFSGYDENVDLSTVLLVPHPYDEIYIRYLEMQIDYANNEYGKYNNSREMYNSAFEAYARHYNRNYTPISKGRFRF